jgi:hypothetical protein
MLLGAKVTILIYHILVHCQLLAGAGSKGKGSIGQNRAWACWNCPIEGANWTKQSKRKLELSDRRILLDKTLKVANIMSNSSNLIPKKQA